MKFDFDTSGQRSVITTQEVNNHIKNERLEREILSMKTKNK